MGREYVASAGETETLISLRARRLGEWTVTIDGVEQVADVRQVRGNTWSVLVGGRSHLVDVDARKRDLVFHVDGRSMRVRFEDENRRRLLSLVGANEVDAGGDEVVVAPIAGRVVKFLVAVGEDVAAGQPVAVLEAMKMENEIRAERGGRVATLHAQPGNSIDTGEPLLTLDAAS